MRVRKKQTGERKKARMNPLHAVAAVQHSLSEAIRPISSSPCSAVVSTNHILWL